MNKGMVAMKAGVLAAFLILIPALALPQAGKVGVFPNTIGTDCRFFDDAEGMRDIYVLHVMTPGTKGERFRVVELPGATMTYVSETVNSGIAMGDTRTGITICHSECLAGPILLVTMHYLAHGTSSHCAQIEVAPHPGAGSIDVLDCAPDGNTWAAGCSPLLINPSACDCLDGLQCIGTLISEPTSAQSNFCTIPVEGSTWGRIKALF